MTDMTTSSIHTHHVCRHKRYWECIGKEAEQKEILDQLLSISSFVFGILLLLFLLKNSRHFFTMLFVRHGRPLAQTERPSRTSKFSKIIIVSKNVFVVLGVVVTCIDDNMIA